MTKIRVLNRELSNAMLTGIGSVLLGTFYTSLALITSYHGRQPSTLAAWEADLRRIPGILRDAKA